MELPNETLTCGLCGKKMIAAWTGMKYEAAENLKSQWEWWCLCGNRKRGIDPHELSGRLDATARRHWYEANPIEPAPDPRTLPPPPKPSDRVDGHCAFCRFYKRNELDPEASRCRRYAPIAVREVTDGGVCSDRTHFPEMHPEGWCGDFERAIQE